MPAILRNTALFVLTLLLFAGCRNEQHPLSDKGLIPREQMIRLMADVEFTEALIKLRQVNISHDSIKKLAQSSYDSLYAHYRLTPEMFKENLNYYQGNLEDFQAMLDSVMVLLTRQKDSALSKNPPEKSADTLFKNQEKKKITVKQ